MGRPGELTLLHVSDLHFGPAYLPKVGAAVLRLAANLGPDIVVASGDFTQRAKTVQFAQAREFLAQLPDVPRIVVPGNHDVPLYRVHERLFAPYRNYRRYIAEQLDSVLRVDGAVVVALNSSSPLGGITNGRIRQKQLDYCRDSFQGVDPAVARIVVAHHPLLAAGDFERGVALPGARRIIDAFTAMQVDLVLGGHLHRGYVASSQDVYAGADRNHGIVLVQCGTTTSRRGRAREREKNSLNVLRVGPQRMTIDHYMYFSDLDRFAPVARHDFPRWRQRTLPECAESAQPSI